MDGRQGEVTAPFFAKSGKEKGTTSTSVAQAELKSAVLATGDIQINRGIAEEIAGVADARTLKDVPPGAAPPTVLRTTNAKQALEDFIASPPTILAQDNKSVVIAAAQDTSRKGQKLRQYARMLQHLRTASVEGLIEVRSVPAAKQRANLLTKNLGSPTEHWKQVEFLQGSQEGVTHFQEEARRYGRLKKSPRQLGHTVPTSVAEEAEEQQATVEEDQVAQATQRNSQRNSAQGGSEDRMTEGPKDRQTDRPKDRRT